MRKGKRIMAVLLLVLLMVPGMQVAAAEAAVYDQAELFTESEIETLKAQGEMISADWDMQILLVTTADAKGMDAQGYADTFYMAHGYEEGRGGALFLIDMDNREVYIDCAGDMIYYLTDSRREEVIDAGYEQLKDGDYAQCMENMLTSTESFLNRGVPEGQYTYNEETGEIIRYYGLRTYDWILAVMAALVVAGISCGIVIGKYRMKWGTYRYPLKEKSVVKLNQKEERFINRIVTTRRIPKNPPPSSGDDGRSTTHSGSDGGTFSGSGRGF